MTLAMHIQPSPALLRFLDARFSVMLSFRQKRAKRASAETGRRRWHGFSSAREPPPQKERPILFAARSYAR